MANVLGELFQNIANAIRSKTGSSGTLKPNEFATAISSIVVGSGGTGGGTSGTGTLKIAAGTFKINGVTDNTRKTISHGLGEMPDLVLVYATAYGLYDYDNDGDTEDGVDGDDAATFFVGSPMLAAWGMKQKFLSSFITSYKALMGDASVAFSSTSSTAGIDTTTSNYLIRCQDDATFEVGGTGTSKLFANGSYAWIAIAGMGGTSADVRYVTFKNGSQTLYKKAVAYGDDCVDVLSKGLISTPTKASTAQYSYTYYGWGASDGGAADSSILKNITEDKTVYAIFSSTVRYYTITYYDSDGTTVLKTESLAYGSTPSYEPFKDGFKFNGWTTSVSTVTGDASYVAKFTEMIGLEGVSWARISEISAAGEGENYFAVGDTKTISLSGNFGTTTLSTTVTVRIIGFNHNSELEGTGIHFGFSGMFISGKYNYSSGSTDGTKDSQMSHWGATNNGGWAGCDLRYDILGSTNVKPSGYGAMAAAGRVGYDATSTCATEPVNNTFMSCLPAELRAVMKPITKYTDNVGGKQTSSIQSNVSASIDYLPLLAMREIFSTDRGGQNSYESNYQQQYAYYAAGGSVSRSYYYLSRTPSLTYGTSFTGVTNNGLSTTISATAKVYVSPVFMV